MEMQVTEIPISEIFADHKFNCRGHIQGQDVVDLARSMNTDGLLQPIVVQPYSISERPEIKYRIIAGYRRFTAARVNEWTAIHAIIRENMTEEQARILNLTENLKRKNLNKLQEALAIQPLILKGFTQMDLAKELGVSYGWVQIREYINELDEHIQKEIGAGLLTDQQIRHLKTIKNDEQRHDYVKQVKKQKLSGLRKADVDINKIIKPKNMKRKRLPAEILDMVEIIVENCGGGTLASIFGAWCGANTDDYSLHKKIQEEAAKIGNTYTIPQNIVEPVSGAAKAVDGKFIKVPA